MGKCVRVYLDEMIAGARLAAFEQVSRLAFTTSDGPISQPVSTGRAKTPEWRRE
jgi:hypothetical protein